METTYLLIVAVSFIISIIVLVKFFAIASDVRSIKHLLQNATKEKPATINADVKTNISDKVKQDVELLKPKLKANECIVQVNATKKVEIWAKTDWLEIVERERAHMFVLLYKNF